MKGFSGARYKSFKTQAEAQAFISENGSHSTDDATRNTTQQSPLTSSIVNKTIGNASRTLGQPATESLPAQSAAAGTHQAKQKVSTPSARDKNSTDNESPLLLTPSTKRQKMDTPADLSLLLSFDGGSRGNPGLAGCGAEIVESRLLAGSTRGTKTIVRTKTRICRYLKGKQTNNVAEYWGMISGLQCAMDMLSAWWRRRESVQASTCRKSSHHPHRVSLAILGDSKLVIQQMKGVYRVGDALRPSFQVAKDLVTTIQEFCRTRGVELQWTFEHVYRDANTIADGKNGSFNVWCFVASTGRRI